MRRKSSRLSIFAFAHLLILAASSAFAYTVPKHADPLKASVRAPAGFVATVVPEDYSALQGQVDGATNDQVSAFLRAAGPEWRFYVDRRSGGMAMVKGQ